MLTAIDQKPQTIWRCCYRFLVSSTWEWRISIEHEYSRCCFSL